MVRNKTENKRKNNLMLLKFTNQFILLSAFGQENGHKKIIKYEKD